MLVLKRRIGDTIFIGINREIAVTVTRIGRGACRIAITAPRDVPIMRGEMLADPGLARKGGAE